VGLNVNRSKDKNCITQETSDELSNFLLVHSLFIFSPFNDVIDDYIGSNDRIIIYNEMEMMPKDTLVANLRHSFHQCFTTCAQMQTSVGPRNTR
jgi:hypothetical protein